eukprot:1354320-Pleurochrysis_carterae.AAC.1
MRAISQSQVHSHEYRRKAFTTDRDGENRAHHMIYRIYTEQPLEGHARFESVVRTDSLNHACLSCPAYLLILYFTGDLPKLPSGRAGANGNV